MSERLRPGKLLAFEASLLARHLRSTTGDASLSWRVWSRHRRNSRCGYRPTGNCIGPVRENERGDVSLARSEGLVARKREAGGSPGVRFDQAQAHFVLHQVGSGDPEEPIRGSP